MLLAWLQVGLLAQSSPGTWEIWIAIGTCVATLLSAVAAFVALRVSARQLLSSVAASNRQHRYLSSLESVKFLDANRIYLFKAHEELIQVRQHLEKLESDSAPDLMLNGAFHQRHELRDRKARLVFDLLNAVEMFALSVNSTVLEIGLANDYLGSFIEHVYTIHAKRIREERRKKKGAFRQLELFLNDLFELRRAKYVISARTIKCLREELAAPSLVDVLERPPFVKYGNIPERSLLRPGIKVFSSWPELELDLHKRGFGAEKYAIRRHAMVKHFRIVEVEVVHEPCGHAFQLEGEDSRFTHADIDHALQGIFRETYRETCGQYPFIADDSPESLERYVRQTELLKRWVAVREMETGPPVIVGHISCTDLAQDGRAIWDLLFDRIKKGGTKVDRSQYLMLQELYVRKEERNAGIARMLIRHALGVIEEQILPRRRIKAENGQVPEQKVALTVVNHADFDAAMDNIYCADGGTILLGDEQGKCTRSCFGQPQRTIDLCVLGF